MSSPRSPDGPLPMGLITRSPNCWQCLHFAVSHEPSFPYACRLMGIISRGLPALEVLRADGRPCQGFTPKPKPPSRGG